MTTHTKPKAKKAFIQRFEQLPYGRPKHRYYYCPMVKGWRRLESELVVTGVTLL